MRHISVESYSSNRRYKEGAAVIRDAIFIMATNDYHSTQNVVSR